MKMLTPPVFCTFIYEQLVITVNSSSNKSYFTSLPRTQHVSARGRERGEEEEERSNDAGGNKNNSASFYN